MAAGLSRGWMPLGWLRRGVLTSIISVHGIAMRWACGASQWGETSWRMLLMQTNTRSYIHLHHGRGGVSSDRSCRSWCLWTQLALGCFGMCLAFFVFCQFIETKSWRNFSKTLRTHTKFTYYSIVSLWLIFNCISRNLFWGQKMLPFLHPWMSSYYYLDIQ